MAIVRGVNSGFVFIAPVADPLGSNVNVGNLSTAIKDFAPTGATKVIEIGWWCDNATADVNYEVGIYDHDDVNNNPENLLAGEDRTNAKGAGSGWKRVTGLNISITAGNPYWIGMQCDTTTPIQTRGDYKSGATGLYASGVTSSTLPDPWTAGSFVGYDYAFYAITDAEAPTGTNIQINIADVWKEIESLKINIGDAWKAITEMKINIGDAWKTIFSI